MRPCLTATDTAIDMAMGTLDLGTLDMGTVILDMGTVIHTTVEAIWTFLH